MAADSYSSEEKIRRFYRLLAAAWGPQHWWPAETRFEVIVGAYLTQNTSWTNVERALQNLRAAGKLAVDAMSPMPLGELETLVRPAGYFRQKAQRLKNFLAFLDAHYEGSLDRMFATDLAELRRRLLALNGVGPETADSILLYAGDLPVFVVDAYTRRIVERHQWMPAGADYESIRALFERALREIVAAPRETGNCTSTQTSVCQSGARGITAPAGPASLGQRRPAPNRPLAGARQTLPAAVTPSPAHAPSAVSAAPRAPLVQVYNEMHALIVGIGKNFCCKQQGRCDQCPLSPFLP